MPAPLYPTTVEEIRELSFDTKHFKLQFKDSNLLPFKAGQFVMLHVLDQKTGKIEKRPYSIASPPQLKGAVELCLNRVEGGFMSNYLCDLKGGEGLTVDGPYGKFLVKEPIERGVLFTATGTGVAPFRSMIHGLFLSGKAEGKEIWLFFGVRYENAILYEEEWKKLAAEYSNFHYIQTISRPQTWTGEKGYVQEKIKKHTTDSSGFDNYICGLPKMVDDVRATCLEMGFPKEKIHVEKYV